MTNHASYDEIMDRLDNALIKNESLQDEIKELKESLKLKNKVGKSYTKKIKGLNELVEDQSKEIEELHAMNWNLSKLLNKEIQEYNLKEYNINLGNKGGKNA